MPIAAGISRVCSARSGGAKYLHFANPADVTSMTLTSGIYDAITMVSTKVFYLHECEWDSVEFREIKTLENGSFKVRLEIEFMIAGLTAANRALLAPLYAQAASCGLIGIVQDNNGVKWVMGYNEVHGKERPLRLVSGNASIGKGLGDAKGDTIIFACDTNEIAYTTSATVPVS